MEHLHPETELGFLWPFYVLLSTEGLNKHSIHPFLDGELKILFPFKSPSGVIMFEMLPPLFFQFCHYEPAFHPYS